MTALARRQRGVVTRAQLVGLGFDPRAIDRRLAVGRLNRLHRGVYALGPIAVPEAAEMAAVLACGEGAVLSHRSAAALWHLLPQPAKQGPIDVTVPRSRSTHRPGIRIHRAGSLRPDEATKLRGIPITTPARTLLDLAAIVTLRELEQATAQALARSLARRSALLSLVAGHRGRSGTRSLRALLDAHERPALTRSEAEERLLAVIRKAQLPTPDVNVRLGPYEVDFLWRDAGLVVEVDGFAFHSDRVRFEADRRRDGELAARGFTVIRVTWRQIAEEPEAVLARLARALARSTEG